MENERASESEIKKRSRFDKISLMRLLDIHIGNIVCLVLSLFNRKRTLPQTVKKILLVKFFGFGNIIMISPVFRQLKETYPDAELIFLTLSNNRKLLSHYKIIDRIIDINISNFLLIPFKILGALIELRKQNIDILIDFEQFSRTSAIISFLGGRKFGIGFSIAGNPREKLYDITVLNSDSEHAVLQFQKLLYYAQIPLLPKEQITLEKIEYTSDDKRTVDDLLKNVPDSFVILHVGNGPNAPEKRWDVENYVELANRLYAKKIQIALIGSGQDMNDINEFKRLFTKPHIDACNIPIPQLAYFLTKANAYVSADTGPAHLAAAMDVPAIILYGPTTPSAYGAWGKNVHFIYKKLWCSPCATNLKSKEIVCINKIYDKCMKDITVDEVEKKVYLVMEG